MQASGHEPGKARLCGITTPKCQGLQQNCLLLAHPLCPLWVSSGLFSSLSTFWDLDIQNTNLFLQHPSGSDAGHCCSRFLTKSNHTALWEGSSMGSMASWRGNQTLMENFALYDNLQCKQR